MTVLASAIIDKVANQLFDKVGVQWARSELLGWLNDGQRQIVMMQPTAGNKTTAVKLVAGARQALPTDGWMLLDIYNNMGTDGATPGRAIRVISKTLMDHYNPTWRTDIQKTEVRNFIYDLQDQLAFWVYPPNDGTGYVHLNYSALPPDITVESTAIGLMDIYRTALIDYIMYKACCKHVEYAGGPDIAAPYWQAFVNAVQGKAGTEEENSPNQSLDPTANTKGQNS